MRHITNARQANLPERFERECFPSLFGPGLDPAFPETRQKLAKPWRREVRWSTAQIAHHPAACLGNQLPALAGGDLGSNPPQRVRFLDEPEQFMRPPRSQRVLQHGQPQSKHGAEVGNALGGTFGQILSQNRLQVREANSSFIERVAIALNRQEGLAAEYTCALDNRLFKWQVLEGMERVVVDEDADGALSRKDVMRAGSHYAAPHLPIPSQVMKRRAEQQGEEG